MPNKAKFLLNLPIYLFCMLVLLPVVFIVKSWLEVDQEIWAHLWQTQMIGLIKNTLILVFGVGIGVTILGVPLAWLTAICEFPGRKLFEWALILPLAVPAYVLGFVILGVFDFGGAMQTLLKAMGMVDTATHLDVRTSFTVILVMTAVLFPYVYLLARAAFLAQGAALIQVSQTLGLRPSRAFFRVAVPIARPAIVAGVSLALMETLADFGTVAIFGYDTFTTAIYKSWFSLFSIETAAQLASLLLLFVICALLLESGSRKSGSNDTKFALSKHRIQLSPPQAFCATCFCTLLLLSIVALPFIQLLIWSVNNLAYFFESRFVSVLLRTFSLAGMSALFVMLIALPFAFASRAGGKPLISAEIAGLGYAIPGSILAVGIMLALAFGDQMLVTVGSFLGLELRPLLLGSLLGLLLAYTIRYFRPGFVALAASLQRLRSSYLESAQLMGVSRFHILTRVSVPLLAPGLLTGALIVFVDVVKEMPASLLLRPFGWDTLAIKVYEFTSEGEWERAGAFALVLVLLSIVPVVLIIRQSRRLANR